MHDNNLITSKEALNSCLNLKKHNNTRIPSSDIDNLIKEFTKNSIIT